MVEGDRKRTSVPGHHRASNTELAQDASSELSGGQAPSNVLNIDCCSLFSRTSCGGFYCSS